MPIYDYRCPECGRTWSDHMPMDRRDDAECDICHVRAERWPPAAPGIAFKGSGFYATDYKGKP